MTDNQPAGPQTEGLWTLEEAAEYLKVSVPTLRRLNLNDGFPFVEVSARHKRVDPDQARDWIRTRTSAGRGAQARSTGQPKAGASPSASAAQRTGATSARSGSFGTRRPPGRSSPSSRSAPVVAFRPKSGA
jgi:excisionase family DNA binding protein